MFSYTNLNNQVSYKRSLLNSFQQRLIENKFPNYNFKFDIMPHFFSVSTKDDIFLGNVFIEWESEDGWVRTFTLEESIDNVQSLLKAKDLDNFNNSIL